MKVLWDFKNVKHIKTLQSSTFVPGTLTLLSLNKRTFPVILIDNKTVLLLDDIQLVHSLGYSNF